MNKANFNLKEQDTNYPELFEFIDNKENTNVEKCNCFRKAFGLTWKNLSDKLLFNFTNFIALVGELIFRKKCSLKIQISLFDALGLICCIILQLKLMFMFLRKHLWCHLCPAEIQDKFFLLIEVRTKNKSVTMNYSVFATVLYKHMDLEKQELTH